MVDTRPFQMTGTNMTSTAVAASVPAYVKQEYIGAVTLLHFSRDGSLLYAGVGTTLYAYETATGKLVTTHDVFARGILHRLDYVPLDNGENFVVFFGQKRLQCVRNLAETPADALAQRDSLLRVGKAKACSDWIFDVRILSEETRADDAFPTVVLGLAHNFIQFWDPNTDQLLRSVICTERCILYSLAFYGRTTEELLVASGTVFQQVLLWAPGAEGDRAEPKQRLHGHDGVIFQLEWSNDASILASVSDDRTVQLWTNQSDSAESKIVEKSDWLTTPWSSRFRAWGHSARLWDVRFCEAGIVTASEDGLAKIWNLTGDCIATLQGHYGKHVWRVAVHPSNRLLATGGGDGAVKIWDVEQQAASTFASAGADAELIRLNIADVETSKTKTKKKAPSVSVRDIVIKQGSPDGSSPDRVFIAAEDGRVFELTVGDSSTSRLLFDATDKMVSGSTPNVSSFALDEDQQFFLIGDTAGTVLVVDVETLEVRACWKAHSSRIMKVWWNKSRHTTLITCSTDGGVREWDIGGAPEATPVLVGNFAGPAKCATSAVEIIDVTGTRNIICGDSRANLFAFSRSIASEKLGVDEAETPSSPVFVLRGVHGRDMIATLLRLDNLLYSGGHDGYICSFLINKTSEDGQITLRYAGRESIKGITTIKQLWFSPSQQLMVFGFYATYAVLYNATAQYRLFNIECGGWRRPHAVLTTAPSAIPPHTFIFTPVTKSAELLVQVHSTVGLMTKSPAPPVLRASLHHQYHGRTTTCARAIGSDRLVSAGEDNSLKLHRLLPVGTVSGVPAPERWTSVSSGIAHTTTIRALDSFYVGSRRAHFLLSGGGKQRLNAWRVHDDLDVLEFLCGQEMLDADQDHRILGLSSFTLGDGERYRMVVACNSEGVIQLLLLDLGDDSTQTPPMLLQLGQCSSSKKPILSCDSIQQGDRALLAVGSTDGMVNVWDLSGLLPQVSHQLSASSLPGSITLTIQQLQPVYKYLAHDMGTNCLCISPTVESPASRFRIISGGDDQNLHVRELTLETLELVYEARARNASGSALKTVSTSRDGRFVYCAGYDQRVSQWRCLLDQTATTPLQLHWQGAAFTECADIADLDVWDHASGHDTVVVVGQGLQTVQFAADQ